MATGSPASASANLALVRLKTRSQFLKIAAKGKKAVRPTLVLQSLMLSPADQSKAKQLARASGAVDAAFLGFTASKKVGNAVARNRAKRRLAAAARQLMPGRTVKGQGLVLIARARAVHAPYAMIEEDIRAALKGLTNGR